MKGNLAYLAKLGLSRMALVSGCFYRSHAGAWERWYLERARLGAYGVAENVANLTK